MPGKHCCYGICKSDSRYPDRDPEWPEIKFFPFPKPFSRLEQCKEWIKACGRPHEQLNIGKIKSYHYVCSKHFKHGEPTPEFPYPTPFDGRPAKQGRQKKRVHTDTSSGQSAVKQQKTEGCNNMNDVETTQGEFFGLHLLAAAAGTQSSTLNLKLKEIEEENAALKRENSLLISRLEYMEAHVKKLQPNKQTKSTQTQPIGSLLDEVQQSKVRKLFEHYTGLTYIMFLALFSMLIPDEKENPVVYKKKRRAFYTTPLRDQLFLVLCRLRKAFTVKDLAFRFSISPQSVSDIFTAWILHMKRQFGYLSWWPHRSRIIGNMPAEFKKNFPTTICIIDCTELKTETPSALKAQSQCYSEYKGATTLKSLVVVDPLGNLMYVSALCTGSISDNDICEESGFYKYLEKLMDRGIVNDGDAIMADKGFRIEDNLIKRGLKLNIPPFASSEVQMQASDVQLTNLIATHRIHVERRISRIKNFNLVGSKIPISLFPVINDIFYVCCYLTNFQSVIIKR